MSLRRGPDSIKVCTCLRRVFGDGPFPPSALEEERVIEQLHADLEVHGHGHRLGAHHDRQALGTEKTDLALYKKMLAVFRIAY